MNCDTSTRERLLNVPKGGNGACAESKLQSAGPSWQLLMHAEWSTVKDPALLNIVIWSNGEEAHTGDAFTTPDVTRFFCLYLLSVSNDVT